MREEENANKMEDLLRRERNREKLKMIKKNNLGKCGWKYSRKLSQRKEYSRQDE